MLIVMVSIYFANWGLFRVSCLLEKGFCLGLIASPAGIMSSGPPALPYALLVPE
jgi:hypothetical protein